MLACNVLLDMKSKMSFESRVSFSDAVFKSRGELESTLLKINEKNETSVSETILKKTGSQFKVAAHFMHELYLLGSFWVNSSVYTLQILFSFKVDFMGELSILLVIFIVPKKDRVMEIKTVKA